MKLERYGFFVDDKVIRNFNSTSYKCNADESEKISNTVYFTCQGLTMMRSELETNSLHLPIYVLDSVEQRHFKIE